MLETHEFDITAKIGDEYCLFTVHCTKYSNNQHLFSLTAGTTRYWLIYASGKWKFVGGSIPGQDLRRALIHKIKAVENTPGSQPEHKSSDES